LRDIFPVLAAYSGALIIFGAPTGDRRNFLELSLSGVLKNVQAKGLYIVVIAWVWVWFHTASGGVF
jgi:hypothetical protein